MKILITSGGTTEKIDEVRSISNSSTGMLGKMIAEAFAALDSTEKIYYVCGLTSLTPDTDKAEVRRIGSVAELETEVEAILASGYIDAAIHCMAVSDYSVKSVTTSELIGASVCDYIAEKCGSETSRSSAQKIITDAIYGAEALPKNGKISSEMDDLVLIMQRTPKIISIFKQLSPKTILVGFKLLNNVPLETLIDVGYGILTKNGCDFVLANDQREINGAQHVGYLIDRSGDYRRLTTKREIAEGIVSAVSGRLSA